MNRYKALALNTRRPDVAATFPRHVFLRAPSAQPDPDHGISHVDNCFESTMVHLTERFNGKEVFLIGTSNLSTMLAKRTQKLVGDVQPEAVLVQTNEEWWKAARLLGFVESQEELTNYHSTLDKYTQMQSFFMWKSTRHPIFWARFYLYSFLWNFHYRLPVNFTFTKPGLEIKHALEEAEKIGAKIHFLGPEFNNKTWARLFHETRMNLVHYVYKRFQYQSLTFWNFERRQQRSTSQVSEPSQFAEQSLDSFQLNWYIQSMDIFFPRFKEIFIDKRDEDLFKAIDQCQEKKVVAVVNQWHMEGIEHLWAHRYGQLPRSVVHKDGMNPIGDMDLQEGLFDRLYNALHREIASSNSRTTPSTWSDWIIGYHREGNWQYEHRDM